MFTVTHSVHYISATISNIVFLNVALTLPSSTLWNHCPLCATPHGTLNWNKLDLDLCFTHCKHKLNKRTLGSEIRDPLSWVIFCWFKMLSYQLLRLFSFKSTFSNKHSLYKLSFFIFTLMKVIQENVRGPQLQRLIHQYTSYVVSSCLVLFPYKTRCYWHFIIFSLFWCSTVCTHIYISGCLCLSWPF